MTAALPPVAADGTRRRWLAGAAATVVVLAGVAVLPARNWFDQRVEIRDTRAELAGLVAANDRLSEKIERMSRDDAIERQARQEFGLVYPGEEPYTVLEAPPPEVHLPQVWPFDVLQDPLARAAARGHAGDDDR